MKLRKELEKAPELHARLNVIEVKARQLLEYSQGGSHLTFTTHGFSHISAVENNYDWLLSENDIASSFNQSEIFCLLCSTFFHDAFMIPPKIGDEEYSRKHHAEKSLEFLQKFKEALTLNIHEVSIISEIIRGHATDDFNSLREEVALNTQLIEIRKLAACLSLSDICHADYRRAPEIVFKYLELNEESAYHWRRHLQISGITRKSDRLIMSAIHFTDEGLKAIEDYKSSIEKQLRIIYPFFQSKLNPITGIELQVEKLKSELDIKLRFQANTPAILDMLIEGVYQRGDVLVRELVQNSLDACLLRSAKANKRMEEYHSSITISLLSERGVVKGIRIDDNGIGMDIIDVQDTVLWIGNSISSRNDIKSLLQETNKKDLIATFGIGLLSCFKSAQKILVKSKKEGNDALEFELHSITDEIKPSESKDNSVGSTFIIELKDEYVKEIDFDAALFYYFRMIKQTSLRVLQLDWDKQSVDYSREQIAKIASTEGYEIHGNPVDDLSRKVCHIEIKGDDFSAWFSISDGESKDSFSTEEGRVTVLNEGVYISSDECSEWLPEHLKLFDGVINFSAKSIDLPVSRDKVVNNKKYVSKRTEISKRLFIAAIEDLVKQSASDSKKADMAVLVLSLIYEKAEKETKDQIVRYLDNLQVRFFKGRRSTKLSDIRGMEPKAVYIEYNVGHFVDDLTTIEGKEIFHKPDDITKLQAAIFQQNGEIVLSADREDRTTEGILESNLLKGYFEYFRISTVDLRTKNVIEGSLRSKPLSAMARQELGQNIKFIYVDGLPNRKAWKVGSEIWINLSNPEMGKIYDLLQSGNFDINQVKLAKILINILAYQFDYAINGILKLMDETA